MGKNKDTMKRVLKFISPYKAKIIIMLLTALVTVGFTLYTPILIGNGVDNIVGPGNVNVASFSPKRPQWGGEKSPVPSVPNTLIYFLFWSSSSTTL